VKHWTEENDAVILHLENGECIRTGRLLVCTNGFTSKILPHLEVVPARNQVLITEPIDNLPFKGCFHYEKGYYYFRNVGNRVLFGGGRHLDKETEQTDERGFTEIVQEAQWKLLTEVILPNRKIQIASRWSGTLGIGPQKKPIIEKISPLVGVAVRMGGMGVAIGTLVGEEGALLMDTGQWESDNG
jgi:glycine/D-amino acid oxidase-like deaminating enzyme